MELLALKSNLMLNLGKFDTFFNLKIKGVHVETHNIRFKNV
jgi:hypothetical protein